MYIMWCALSLIFDFNRQRSSDMYKYIYEVSFLFLFINNLMEPR